MLHDPIPLLDKLDKMKDSEIVMLYRKVFQGPDADLVLADLMDHFFEFKPTASAQQAGSQAVIIYIKNRLLGIHEPDPIPEERPDESNT